MPDPKYKVWYGRDIVRGTARKILEKILEDSRGDSPELEKISVDGYARALIEDAPYFMPKKLLNDMEREHYASDFDRALNYLSATPTSGVRILPNPMAVAG